MPAGRPTKYDEALCEKAVAFMAEGYSLTALAGEFDVSRDTVYEWQQQHEEFSDAIKRGRAKGARFWENKLRSAESSPQVTSSIFALKNRAADDWRDKVDHEMSGPNGGPIETKDASTLEVARRLAFLLALGAKEAG